VPRVAVAHVTIAVIKAAIIAGNALLSVYPSFPMFVETIAKSSVECAVAIGISAPVDVLKIATGSQPEFVVLG
jgi:hypothetical protein